MIIVTGYLDRVKTNIISKKKSKVFSKKKSKVSLSVSRLMAMDKNPLVRFLYPSSKNGSEVWRLIRVFAANGIYLIGLDLGDDNRFKRFLVSKCRYLSLIEFNPDGVL